ncbi:MAG: hypothetical protein A4E71_01289 [Smithella sp. PtaU1.Bin162]|nr:MAG: hypothetical protein A4E71_01289 [Smithella sp. PtaU1.Bin162]
MPCAVVIPDGGGDVAYKLKRSALINSNAFADPVARAHVHAVEGAGNNSSLVGSCEVGAAHITGNLSVARPEAVGNGGQPVAGCSGSAITELTFSSQLRRPGIFPACRFSGKGIGAAGAREPQIINSPPGACIIVNQKLCVKEAGSGNGAGRAGECSLKLHGFGCSGINTPA